MTASDELNRWESGVHELSPKKNTYLMTDRSLNSPETLDFLTNFITDFMACNPIKTENFPESDRKQFAKDLLFALKNTIASKAGDQDSSIDQVFSMPLYCHTKVILFFVTPANKLQQYQELLFKHAGEGYGSFADTYINQILNIDINTIRNAYGLSSLSRHNFFVENKSSTNKPESSGLTVSTRSYKRQTSRVHPLYQQTFRLQKAHWSEQRVILSILEPEREEPKNCSDFMLAAEASLFFCLSHDQGQVYFETCTGANYQKWCFSKSSMLYPKSKPGYGLTLDNKNHYRVSKIQNITNQINLYNGYIYDESLSTMMGISDTGQVQTHAMREYASRVHFISSIYIAHYLPSLLNKFAISYPHSIDDTKTITNELLRFNLIQYLPERLTVPSPTKEVGTTDILPNKKSSHFLFDLNIERRQVINNVFTYWEEPPYNLLITDKYARPSEEIIINVSSRTILDPEPIYVLINLHTDVLTSDSPNVKSSGFFNRPPRLSVLYRLRNGINRIRPPYGGTIAFASWDSSSEVVDIEVSNAVDAPMFIVNNPLYSSEAIKNNTHLLAPWAVLQGERTSLIVPTDELKTVKNFTSLMNIYDQIVEHHELLWGMEPDDITQAKKHPKHIFVQDTQITTGYGHGGSLIPVMPGWHLTDENKMDFWGIAHELGHSYQGIGWHRAFGTETSVNTYTLHAQLALQKRSKVEEMELFETMIQRIKNKDRNLYPHYTDIVRVHYEKLIFLLQIVYSFPEVGWKLFPEVNRKERAAFLGKEGYRLYYEPQEAIDIFFRTASEVVGHNLEDHFNTWGIIVSDSARDSTKHLPKPDFIISLSQPWKPDSAQKYKEISLKYISLKEDTNKLKNDYSSLINERDTLKKDLHQLQKDNLVQKNKQYNETTFTCALLLQGGAIVILASVLAVKFHKMGLLKRPWRH
ncbi:M60 family metallopeptidase [Endozoicomonas montiporae]|nr:M60 family metallopeptidase [Endozoicomonas montiporae]